MASDPLLEQVAEAIGGAIIDANLVKSDYAIDNVEAWNTAIDNIARAARAASRQPVSGGTHHEVTQDDLIERALLWFQDEYRKHFPQGGDAQDHGEAEHAAIEAVVVALTQMRPCPYCDPQTPGFQRVDDVPGHLERCACDRGFYQAALSPVCGRLLVGQGSDTADPLCQLPRGHKDICQPVSGGPEGDVEALRRALLSLDVDLTAKGYPPTSPEREKILAALSRVPADGETCGHRSPLNYDHTRWAICDLPAGHDGIHRDSGLHVGWKDRYMPSALPADGEQPAGYRATLLDAGFTEAQADRAVQLLAADGEQPDRRDEGDG